jgi:3-hydroxyacyl-CoA dehydrogenase / enoyl-CoA hydratase / 3-hydroxybutyryl-CoA epimerase
MEKIWSGNAWSLEKHQDIAILTFDLAGEKVNKLGEVPLRELSDSLDKIKADSTFKAVLVRSAKKSSFIVGADINVIKTLTDKSQAVEASKLGQDVFSKLEDLKIPTLAAVDGPCMGGGTELILACKYRVCSDSSKTQIGLPEIKLGILPGWGGSYRMPKLVGWMNAMDIILSTKAIRANKAPKIGLVDAVLPEAIFEEKSLECARSVASGKGVPGSRPRSVPLVEKLLTGNPIGKSVFFGKAREATLKATKGHYPAPLKALELMKTKHHLSRDAYMKEEAKVFGDLWETSESKNLVNLFLLMEAAKREVGADLSKEEVKALAPIGDIAVLGAGVMGGGIGSQAAQSGVFTTLKDLNFAAITKGLQHARSLVEKRVKRKHYTKAQGEQVLAKIRGQVDYKGFCGHELVIEAIVENLEIKKSVFSELENHIKEDAIVASNTSSLRLTEMAKAFKHPERFVGLHFFNPVEKMPLIEVITHEKTDPKVTARVVAFSKAIGKTPVVVKDGPGFLVNRLLMPWLNEAGYCLEEGYSIQAMDKALKKFGMPMGPFELLDEVGLDVAAKVGHILHSDFGDRAKPAALLDKVLEHNKSSGEKRLGHKTFLGFYKWNAETGRRESPDNDFVTKVVHGGTSKSKLAESDQEMIERQIFPMINEAARSLLEDKIVQSPEMLDLAMIFGTGFPPFRGGLLRYADSVGVPHIVQALKKLESKYGPRFAPAPSLAKVTRFYND